MKQAHVKVIGHVQGVGFRYFVMRTANELGLNGWVRNRRDGSVEIIFEGEEKDIKTAIKACRIGPSRARVSQIYIDWMVTENSYESFNVLS